MLLAPTEPTGTWHDRVATPFMCTVQAPHWAMPQPYFVPVSPIVSRITQSSGVSDSTSTLYDFPLMERAIILSSRSEWCASPYGISSNFGAHLRAKFTLFQFEC